VVHVGVVRAGRGDVVDLLVRAGLRLRDVDELRDLGTAEAGDLHGSHGSEVRAQAGDRLGQSRTSA
jgi:hypothetical protein